MRDYSDGLVRVRELSSDDLDAEVLAVMGRSIQSWETARRVAVLIVSGVSPERNLSTAITACTALKGWPSVQGRVVASMQRLTEGGLLESDKTTQKLRYRLVKE